jgi:hypothetical protein
MKTLNLMAAFILSVCLTPTAYNQGCDDLLKSMSYKMSGTESNQRYSKFRNAYKEIEIHKTYKFKVVFYGNKKYLMGIDSEAAYEPVHIRMIDANNNVLYDNEKNQYIGFVDFSLEKTQTITVEITIVASELEVPLPVDQRVCLGIRILSQ